jgi:thiamine-phosphate diphosphorylase
MDSPPILMAIVGPETIEIPGLAESLIRGGASVVQVRVECVRQMLRFARAAVTKTGGARVALNSRPDVAWLAGAHGVHLKERGLSAREVRDAFPALTVGVSRHTREGLLQAEADGADYALLGPVFGSPGKEDRALGLPAFERLIRGLTIPVLAVGGVDAANAASCIRAGAAGVAAIRPFADASLAEESARAMRRALENAADPMPFGPARAR